MHFAWKYLPALGVYIYKYMHLYIIHASVYIDVYPETTKRWLKTMSRDIFILMILRFLKLLLWVCGSAKLS